MMAMIAHRVMDVLHPPREKRRKRAWEVDDPLTGY
jgi:hypothetical protein